MSLSTTGEGFGGALMDDSRTGLVAAIRRVLRRDRSRDAAPTEAPVPAAPTGPTGAPNGVPTPQQLSSERTGADPVWDC